MSRHILSRVWLALALGLLAACGSAGNSAAPAPQAAQPTSAPPAPAAAGASTAAPQARATAASAPAATAQTTAPAAPTGQPAGIPEGTTAEGYHVLGRADAPVALVMYSDFL